MNVTAYKQLTETKQGFNSSVDTILSRFKNDDKFGISNLSSLSKEDYQKAKKSLPIVCFGGTFSSRSKKALIKASGLLILDFDNVDIQATKKTLIADKHCFACFASPSGKGVKALMRIDTVKNDEEYKRYYSYFERKYKDIDKSGSDISRACFFCYDSDLYLNKEAEMLFLAKEQKTLTKQVDSVKNDYALASKVCEIIRHAREGERHTKILAASRLMGGYVGAKKITYSEAERILLQEADLKNDDWKDNLQTVKDGLKHGMQSPIKDTAQLDKEVEKEHSVMKYGKIYYTLGDKREEVLKLYETGQTKGYDIGLDCIDEHYTCKTGSTTYVYGAPYSGKTQFWFWYLIALSKRHGLKHAIFSPETGSAKEIFAELLQMTAMQDFHKTFNKQMSQEALNDAMAFVDAHFIIIDPSHKVITHIDFFNYIDEIERVYNVKVHTATIDPFNEFRQDLGKFSNRQDLYLEAVLSEVRENARTNDRHNCIITHVQDQQILTANNIRYYPQPTYREIAGGQAWSRKGMSMLSVWRPKEGLRDQEGVPYESNATVIDVQKSKPKGTGKVGKVVLLYDTDKHSYTDMNSKSPLYENQGTEIESKYNSNINYSDESFNEPPF